MTRLDSFRRIFGSNWVTGRYLLPQLVKIGKTVRGDVLDLACGESPFRELFRVCHSYVRVDFFPADAEVISGDMTSIPLESKSVDLVLLFQAITDVPNPCAVLKEVRRVLRPGGRLVIYETMCYPEHDLPRDCYRLMPGGLRCLAKEAGLSCLSIVYLGSIFTRFASLLNNYIFARLLNHFMLRPIGLLMVSFSNLVLYSLDRVMPSGSTASDYLAVLTLAPE